MADEALLCMTHSHISPYNFKCCASVVLYIILLEVTRKLSCFCKMARRWKVIGPRWIKIFTQAHWPHSVSH